MGENRGLGAAPGGSVSRLQAQLLACLPSVLAVLDISRM